MSRTLIEKLRSSMYRLQRGEYEQGYNAGITKSIAIVRQHEAERQEELVTAVFNSITIVTNDAPEGSVTSKLLVSARMELAKAAVAAIGDATKERFSDVRHGTVADDHRAGVSRPPSPANEAYQKVSDALQKAAAHSLGFMGIPYEVSFAAKFALDVLPALKPTGGKHD